ncbi:MAG: hypothetical protein WBF18_10355, partial [Solirubrobacterales bacterium]
VPARRRSEPARPARQTPARAAGAQDRSAFARLMRGIGGLLLIAIVAAIVAATILLLTDAGSSTDVGKFIDDNINTLIDNIKDYVNQNTGN